MRLRALNVQQGWLTCCQHSCMQDFKGADFELLNIYCVPTKPGYVRLIVRSFLGGPAGLPLGLRIAGASPAALQGVEACGRETRSQPQWDIMW